jgi:exopolyphosphatase/guanosine-5'-triphosphate,3'-diphosphate pyrophosphatase
MKLAAIDIGSNAVRLQIASTNDPGTVDPYKRIEFVRIPVRLGDDAFRKGKISKPKRKMFYNAMEAFALLMEAFEVEHYMACATSALRDAKNGQSMVEKVEKETGIKIEIIDGKRESEIILKSVAHMFKPNRSYLTIDVGGGSTEMTVIKNRRAYDSVSFDIGTVRLLDDAIKKKTWKELEDYVKSHVSDISQTKAIATSGTINKIASIIKPSDSGEITTEELQQFYTSIKKLTMKERVALYKLNPDRADVIEPSASIYLQILQWANIDRIAAPAAGLKDGMIYDLIERFT